ncbi:MAG: DUF4169 family protein [Hyphomonadaceae bacterium]|nr:DUF4169 family protein [Hyphomonadaceae bacterium]
MAEPINFNKARKAKLRSDKEKRATENRIKFGRTKAEKQLDKAKTDKLNKHIDDHELDP